MSLATRFGLSLTAVGAIGLGVWIAQGCQPSETAGPQPIDAGSGLQDAGGGVAYCGAAGDICCGQPTPPGHAPVPALGAGETPNPKCDDGDETQCATSTTCPITETPTASMPNGCGSIAPTSCEPLANNTGAVENFRMRRLIIVAPTTLASQVVQNSVINPGVDMAEIQCGNTSGATGAFSWLLSFDTDAGTLKTGGAPPCDITDAGDSCDPFTTGYCFVNESVTTPAGRLQVQPVTVKTTKAADGTLQTASIPSLNIPIFYEGSVIILPISQGSMQGVSISPDGNCIGTINVNALAGDCSDSYQTCSKWLTAGALTGYITLQEANNVQVQSLDETLCSLLTVPPDTYGPSQPVPGSTTNQTVKSCTLDGGVVVDKGNYCSKLPDGGSGPATATCADSVWLAATFAASAVHINDGTGVAACSGDAGSGPTDAGTD